MAVKTFHLLNATAIAPGWFGQMQEGGSTPAAALSSFGWTVAKSSTAFWRARMGATATATTTTSTSYIDPAPVPLAGTGATNTTSGDSFISPIPYTGSFAPGNWTFSIGMRTAAATTTGRIRFRVWASDSADGSLARQLTSAALVGSIVTMNAIATTFTSSVTWNAPLFDFLSEYLFFACEWNLTAAGSSNSCTAQFYQSASTITTTDFVTTGGGGKAMPIFQSPRKIFIVSGKSSR
jgi:hypothetical protein